MHCLGREERAWLIAHDTDELPEAVVTEFEQFCQQRRSGTPLAYLLGFREFWSLKLKVTPDVLIPRPETEYLVEWAIEISESQHCSSLLDMGTGSGAIALAMKSACPQLEVTATDESTGALAVAHENAEALGLDIELTESDWFRGIAGRVWSLIVSNPPYIAANDPHLTAGDLRFEPTNALTDGDDGLAAIRTIIDASPEHLEVGGWLLIEHGYDQAASVAKLMTERGFGNVTLRHDLAGRPRGQVDVGQHERRMVRALFAPDFASRNRLRRAGGDCVCLCGYCRLRWAGVDDWAVPGWRRSRGDYPY